MKKILKIFLAAIFALFAAGCSQPDDDPTPVNRSELQKWIEEKLESEYLWNEDVKSKTPDYTKNYSDFFYSLLSYNREDGKHDDSYDYFYSYILKKDAQSRATSTTENSLGFECAITISFQSQESNMFSIYATVTFVYEGSPAYNAGIRRGSHIYKVDGEEFNIQNYADLFYKLWPESASGLVVRTRELGWCSLEQTGTREVPGTNEEFPIASRYDEHAASIVPAMVEADPVYEYKVFENEGYKTAYLVYNSFETGGDDHPYDDKLKKVFREFKTEGVTDLVLDLRYNRGGYVSSCQLLSSMIVSAAKLGAPFMKKAFNSSKIPQVETSNFLTEAQMSGANYGQGSGIGANLSLSRLFVLVTGSSASASEALIHCLRGAETTVYLIGVQTEGKNVGMTLFDSDNYSGDLGSDSYEMWPVTFHVQDANGNGFSSDGFDPDTDGFFTEYDEILDAAWLPLGDENEPMLKMALGKINGAIPLRSRSASSVGVRSGMPAGKILRPLPLMDTGLKQAGE